MSSDPQNPYSSPVAVPEIDTSKQATSRGKVVPASQGKRFVNFLVDNAVLYGINFVVGIAAGTAFAAYKNDEFTQEELAAFQFTCFFLGLIVTAVYYTVLEVISGRTLGKLLTGTKVVATNGSPASVGQILGRSLCRFIPFEAFSFFGGAGRPVGWHDSISKTRVVEIH